jgi:hypothetical protein
VQLSATCAAGYVAVGGGWTFIGANNSFLFVHESEPTSLTTWQIEVYNGTGASITVTPRVICLRIN